MFFAPKEIKKETGESFYNPHRTMVSKEFFDAAHHLFNYKGKSTSWSYLPSSDCSSGYLDDVA